MQVLAHMRIDTKRLMLRKFTLEDSEYVFRNWAHNEDNVKFLDFPKHNNVETSLKQVSSYINDFGKNDTYMFAICLKETGIPIGFFKSFNFDKENSSSEIEICIGKEYWNKGYATESIKGFTNLVYDFTSVDKIFAEHDNNNIAAKKLLKKNNFNFEDKKENSYTNNMGTVDSSIYSLIKKDLDEE